MNIADALLLQKDLAEEVARLRTLAKQEGWEYRTTSPDAKWQPNFDLEKNHQEVVRLSKLHRRLSKAITRANISTELQGIDDANYAVWL